MLPYRRYYDWFVRESALKSPVLAFQSGLLWLLSYHPGSHGAHDNRPRQYAFLQVCAERQMSCAAERSHRDGGSFGVQTAHALILRFRGKSTPNAPWQIGDTSCREKEWGQTKPSLS